MLSHEPGARHDAGARHDPGALHDPGARHDPGALHDTGARDELAFGVSHHIYKLYFNFFFVFFSRKRKSSTCSYLRWVWLISLKSACKMGQWRYSYEFQLKHIKAMIIILYCKEKYRKFCTGFLPKKCYNSCIFRMTRRDRYLAQERILKYKKFV